MNKYDCYVLLRELGGNSSIQMFTVEANGTYEAERTVLDNYKSGTYSIPVVGIKTYPAQDWESVRVYHYVTETEAQAYAAHQAPLPDTPIT